MIKHIFNENSKIYILVPGFLGNYEESLMQKLLQYFVSKKHNVVAIEIQGNENINGVLLSSLGDMIKLTEDTYTVIRTEFHANEIEVISHSQGCLVSLYASQAFNSGTKLTFLAPSIFLNNTVLKRITENEYQRIKNNEILLCKMSSDKYKLINKKWIESYEHYPSIKNIPDNNLHLEIIRPLNDNVDIENISFLKEKFSQSKITFIEGDHIFKNPESSFNQLINILI